MPSIVRSSLEAHLWTQAQSQNEWATTKFWEHLIRGQFPSDDNWVVALQQPPTDDPQDRRRVKLVVDQWTGTMTHRLFILEAKKHKASQSEIDILEQQAFEACITMARLWVAHVNEPYLVPWRPMGTELSHKDSYLEVHSISGNQIEDGWTYVKKHIQMPESELVGLRKALHGAIEGKKPSSSTTPGPDSDYRINYTTNAQYGPSSASSNIYPAVNQSTSGSSNFVVGSSYTLPIVQESSKYRGADSIPVESALGSGDTTFGAISDGGRFSSPSEEASPTGENEDPPLIPESAVFVEVEIENKGSGSEVYHFRIGKDKYSKDSSDWEDGKVKYQGKIYPCVFCVWKSTNQHFYVWDLRNAKPIQGKVKEGNNVANEGLHVL
ncbi:hypothetical protein DL95DRAFT_459869 [Leptodontidium sp. 2 PMI_412]|nr:hypothetical protein DL95DRAFT_459869 [Leptodontidium sp. 2 PMI_412]